MLFRRNDQNELYISPQWYIEKMVDNYKRLFGKSPSHHSQSPLESNDHPEIDPPSFLVKTTSRSINLWLVLCNGPSALAFWYCRNYMLRFICASTSSVIDHKLMWSDRNYTAMRTHVRWSVHLSALHITQFTWEDGLQIWYASDVVLLHCSFPSHSW
jgi:hypothetical protein